MQPIQPLWFCILTHLLYRPSTLRWMTALEVHSPLSAVPLQGADRIKLGRWNYHVTPSQLERRIDLAITDNCMGTY